MSRRSETLTGVEPENFVEVTPNDAEDYGIEDGDYEMLNSRRGEIEMEVRVTEDD